MSIRSVCIYRVRADATEKFERLLERHWPTLHRLGLATDTPPLTYRGTDDTGGPVYFEVLAWRDADGPSTAHELPDVMAIWEPMGQLCEERPGRLSMEFPHVEEIHPHGDGS